MSDFVAEPAAFPGEFESALNEGDLGRLAALYDEEAVLHTRSNEVRSGSAAVHAEMLQLISAKARIENSLRNYFRCDDIALIIVDYILHLPSADGSTVAVTGTATNVLRNRPGKGWRMIIANPRGTS